jgi:hypothetical protein
VALTAICTTSSDTIIAIGFPGNRAACGKRLIAEKRPGQFSKLGACLTSEVVMPTHAFEAVTKTRKEVEVRHIAEGHRFKFSVVVDSHGKRILSDSVEVVANEGSAHSPEMFSGSARAFAVTIAHRAHAID